MDGMTPEPLTRERRREMTRNALLDAATQVFSQRGFAGASLEEIAETAGFTRGAIYKNFANKEELFLAVFDRVLRQQLDGFTAAMAGDAGDLQRNPARAADMWRSVLARDADLFACSLEFRLYALRNPQVRERFAEHQRATRRAIAQFIEAQVAAAGFTLKMPSETLAAILDATSIGFLEEVYVSGLDAHLYERFLEMIVPAMIEEAPTAGSS